MKRLFITLLFAPLFSVAQDCKTYYFMTNNSSVEMTMYDKKGKESGKQTWKISDVKKTGSGFQSQVASTFVDEKGKEITSGKGTYKCEGGILKADVRLNMPQEQMQAYNTTDAKFDNAYIEYPAKPVEGQALANVDFKMDVTNKSGLATTITFKETNRKVEKKETITSPAGTWEAYLITYDAVIKTQVGPMGIPVTLRCKEWFVPNFGIVKTETYNKGGKLIGSTLITSIKK
jgi:hypothetical protein